jgi:hypothetical protein
MPNDSDSLKAEMTERIRADWEPARERRPAHVDEITAAPEPPEPIATHAEPRRGLLRRLFS